MRGLWHLDRKETWILLGLCVLLTLLLWLMKMVAGREGAKSRSKSKSKSTPKPVSSPKPVSTSKPVSSPTSTSARPSSTSNIKTPPPPVGRRSYNVYVGNYYFDYGRYNNSRSGVSSNCPQGNTAACAALGTASFIPGFNSAIGCKKPPFKLTCPINFCMTQKDVDKLKQLFPGKDPVTDSVSFAEVKAKLYGDRKYKFMFPGCAGTCKIKVPMNVLGNKEPRAPYSYEWMRPNRCVIPDSKY